MSDFTLEDVQNFFTDEYNEGPFEDGYGEFLWAAYYTLTKTFDITLNGQTYTAKIVEYFDEDREWVNNMHYIFEVDGRVFKFPGVHRSHEGSYWEPEDITEGKMVTKPVMVWESN